MGKSIPSGKAKVKPRGLTRRPQHSEDKLLDAARLVFARDGLRAATVDDIAAQAGSTKPTFYARFGSKHELYEATFRREVDALTEHLLAAYADAGTVPMREFVRRAVDAWFAFAAARPDGLELLFFGDHPGTLRAPSTAPPAASRTRSRWPSAPTPAGRQDPARTCSPR